jgi:predicted ester cyclase
VSQEQLKLQVRRHFEEVLNQGRIDVIEEIYAPTYVLHAPVSTGDTVGYAGLTQRVLDFRTGFPDIAFTVDDLIADGGRASARYTFVGTHTGQFGPLAPTGRAIDVSGILYVLGEDGRMAEGWSGFDSLAMMQQLGVAGG